MISIKTCQPRPFLRKLVAFPLLFAAALMFSSLLFAKGLEPGPEADGKWICEKLVTADKEMKYVEVGTLELRGRTYRTASKGDSLDGRTLIPFTANAAGEIKWSNSFSWVSYVGAINKSLYSLKDGKVPMLEIDFSDNHVAGHMSCSKAE